MSSLMLYPKWHWGSNLLNQLASAAGTDIRYIARKLTLGRLSIVGERSVPPKVYRFQKSGLYGNEKHGNGSEIKHEKSSIRDNDTRHTILKSKIDAYEDFAQQPANLLESVFRECKPIP